jgi:hypothetical protein
MEALFELQEEDGAEDRIIAKADEVLANPEATAFDKSSAAYLAGAAWQSKETNGYANAIKYYKLAVDSQRPAQQQPLPRDDAAGADGGPTATTPRRWRCRPLPDRDQVRRRNAMDIKTPDHGSAWTAAGSGGALEKLLAAKPNDKKTMLNLASLYLQAEPGRQGRRDVRQDARRRPADREQGLRDRLPPAGQHRRPREGRDGADRRRPAEGDPAAQLRDVRLPGPAYYEATTSPRRSRPGPRARRCRRTARCT